MSQLELKDVSYYYNSDTMVLKNVSYEFEPGKIYAITGRSGAGKTTLLSLLSRLTKPTGGEILYDGKDITKMDQYEYRSKDVGVIFQSYNLIQGYNAIDNVILSLDVSGDKSSKKEKHDKAVALLTKVGLNEDEMNRKVLKLSGGQQQRVAIARAISFNPKILLADEPTGNLDGETEKEILCIFKQLAFEENKCIIIVTHSPSVANAADEKFALAR